jgi:hypothetical protein
MPGPPTHSSRFVDAIVSVCESQFPRRCPACERVYATFAEYLRLTLPLGHPMEFDPEPDDPIGLVDFANCACGSTISVRWESGPGPARIALRSAIAQDVTDTSTRLEVLLTLREAVAVASRDVHDVTT